MTKKEYQEINNPAFWDKNISAGTTCSQCHNLVSQHLIRLSSGKVLCERCVFEQLRRSAYSRFHDYQNHYALLSGDTQKIPVEIFQYLYTIHSHIEEEGQISRKFLKHFEEVVDFLGYTSHLLGQEIRTLAYHILYNFRDDALPIITRRIEGLDITREPWQYPVNMGVFLASVKPAGKKIQIFLQSVWNHPKPEARNAFQEMVLKTKGRIHTADVTIRMKEGFKLLDYRIVRKSDNRIYEFDYAETDKVFDFFMKEYTVGTLRYFYTTYWQDLFQIEDTLGEESQKSPAAKKGPIKRELALLFTVIITHKELFLEFFNQLSSIVQELFTFVVFSRTEYPVHDIEEELGTPLVERTRGRSYSIKLSFLIPEFSLFKLRSEDRYSYEEPKYYVYCPPQLIPYVRNYLEKPDILKLKYLETIGSPLIFHAPGEIDRQLQNLADFIGTQAPVLNKNGTISATYLKKLRSHFAVEEFYPESTDKDLKTIRTVWLVLFLDQFFLPTLEKTKGKTAPNREASIFRNLKESLRYFLKKPLFSIFLLENGLKYLNFDRNYKYYLSREGRDFEKHLSEDLTEILECLHEDSWLLFDSLITHYMVEDLIFPVFEKEFGSFHYYTDSSYYSSREKMSIGSGKNIPLAFSPFLRCWFFFLAHLGLVELAYTEPVNPLKKKAGKDYLSPFDGLEAVRLTPLGAYVLGRTKEAPAEKKILDFEVTVDEHYLIIYTSGSNPGKEFLLETMAEKKRPGMYSVSYSHFVKDCKTLDDVERKIDQFRNNFCRKPSSVWENFFQSILSRYHQITSVESYQLYKIQNNALLKELFSNDPVLRKYCLRAEGHHVLIRKNKLGTVKKRLEKEGFVTEL